ncbi:MAG: PKD domain-containing protein, partial [Bacteroidia bacterium]
YTVSVTPSCVLAPITGTVVVAGSAGSLTLTNTQTNITCNGANNGTATANATGTAPYTYSWTPSGGTAATATGLAPGTYTATVTDHTGCSGTTTVTITQPPAIVLTTSSTTATCSAADGSATVSATGGTGAYTYSWTPSGATTATASNIASGTYSITVTDANHCTMTTTVTVPNSGGTTVSVTQTNVSCNGGSDGTATATITGGTAPFTQSWTPSGGTALTATGLAAGAYTIHVTDNTGCTTTATVTITQPTAVTSTVAQVNVLCNGGSNGSATVTPAGGNGGYTYLWAPSGGTGATASNLAAGTYNCTITDSKGCTGTASVTITQPAALTITTSGVAATCFGKCNGQLICIPAGGTTPYTYSWTTGCTTASCNNVCAGVDSIKLTDGNGCIVRDTATVHQPAALAITMNSHTAYCNQKDGSACATVTGGTGADTYTWKPSPPGSTTNCYTNIGPGTYTVIVHDGNNCPDSNTVVVPNKPGETVTIPTSTNPTCFGGTNGSATALAAGGTIAYTYNWAPAPLTGQGTANAGGLSAGTYAITVKDSAGCTATASVIITQPPAVTVAPMAATTICIGQCANLTASGGGGTPGYTFTWSLNGTDTITHVCPVTTTTYTVVATDSKLCNSPPATVTVTVNPPIEVAISPARTICPGSSDTLQIVATGGNGTYSYTWSPAAGILGSSTVPNPIVSPAVPTTYTVIVSDNCGTPTDSITVTVNLYPAPVVSFVADDTLGCAPLCATFTSVSIPACASGTWNFGDGTTGTGCTNVKHCYPNAGTYSITENIIDINGCKANTAKNNYITVWPLPEAAYTMNPQPAFIIDPVITFTDQSAGSGLTWLWSFGDVPGSSSILQNPQFTYPDTGCYVTYLIVTNSFGCKDTATHPVCIKPEFTFYAPNSFTPNHDGLNDTWTPKGIGIDPKNYHLMIYDRWGNQIWETKTWGEAWDGKANGGSDVAQIDTYVWRVVLMDVLHIKHIFTGHCNIIK